MATLPSTRKRLRLRLRSWPCSAALFTGVVLSVWLAAPGSDAAPLKSGMLDLDVLAPAGCPGSPEVLRRAEALLGSSMTEALREHLGVRITITQRGLNDFVLVVDTVQGQAAWTRSVDGQSCQELADAGALILAVAVDPMLAEHRSLPVAEPPAALAGPPADPGTAPTPAPAVPAPASGEAPYRSRASAPQLQKWVEVAALADGGSLPGFAPGLGVAAGVRWGSFEGGVGANWHPTKTALVVGRKGGEFGLSAADLRACLASQWRRVDLAGCALFEIGSMSATGVGTDRVSPTTELWLAPGLGPVVHFRLLDQLSVGMSAWGLMPLTRPRFELVNVNPGLLHQPGMPSFRWSLDLRLTIE